MSMFVVQKSNMKTRMVSKIKRKRVSTSARVLKFIPAVPLQSNVTVSYEIQSNFKIKQKIEPHTSLQVMFHANGQHVSAS